MSKEIRYAGFSVLSNGIIKFRTASDQRRIDQLIGFGEQVHMVLLDRPAASKSEAAKQLLTQGDRWIPEAQALFVRTARDDNPFAKPKKKSGTVKVKSTKADPVEAYFMAVEADDVKLTAKQAAKLRAEFNARVKEAYEAN
jgi:hypothetical protein